METAMSEDRVRDAVRAVFDVIHVESNVFFPPPGVYARCSAALRPYVTPAPALPPGTVAVSVETLREWKSAAGLIASKPADHIMARKLIDEIDALIPPPPRPEPPKELVAEWERIADTLYRYADTLYRYQIMSPMDRPLSKETHCARTVAALRAAWEAKGGA